MQVNDRQQIMKHVLIFDEDTNAHASYFARLQQISCRSGEYYQAIAVSSLAELALATDWHVDIVLVALHGHTLDRGLVPLLSRIADTRHILSADDERWLTLAQPAVLQQSRPRELVPR
jgi:hypothetical protein